MAVAVVVALVGPVGRASADEAQNKAMEHFREGRKLYQISDYRAALQEFKRAFLFNEDPVFLFNIAQCHRQLGEREEALTFYKRYVAAAPEAQNRAQVEKIIRELQSARPTAAPEPAPPPPAPVTLAARPPEPGLPLVATAPAPEPESAPVYKRWWFWGLVGAAAAGAATAVLLSRRQPADPVCPMGVKC